MTDTSAEGVELSAEHIDELRREVRGGAAASHFELADTLTRLMRRFGISYRELRQIADVPLPDYLAGVPEDPDRQIRSEPTPELTAEQMAELLSDYRDLLSTGASAAVVRKRLEAFSARFGTRVFILKRLLAADELANRQLYEEVRAAGKQQRIDAEERRKAEGTRRKDASARKGVSGKARKSRSVWTIGGGLPGQGRGS